MRSAEVNEWSPNPKDELRTMSREITSPREALPAVGKGTRVLLGSGLFLRLSMAKVLVGERALAVMSCHVAMSIERWAVLMSHHTVLQAIVLLNRLLMVGERRALAHAIARAGVHLQCLVISA
jgi:hypothetical protein